MRKESDLFPYQVDAAQAVIDRKRIAIFLEPGYGKTVITLSALAKMNKWPILVAAPSRVVKEVWHTEAAEWSHLSNLVVTPLVGSPSNRKALLQEMNHIEVISYDNLMWLSDQVNLEQRYKGIVFDELSKMKTPGTKRFKRYRARCMLIPLRVGLTGTPVGNHLLDLWGEMFMVAGKEALGPTFTEYKTQYFRPADFRMRRWNVMPGAEEVIHERVRPHAYVLPAQPEVKIPPVVVNEIKITVPHDVQEEQAELVRELFVMLENGVEIEALEASTLAGKLRQYASGAVYVNDTGSWVERHTEKLDAVQDLVDELQGEPLLLFYWYKHELQRLKAKFDVVTLDDKNAIQRWNQREVPLLVAHPQSAGHGINLQAGGHNVAWFTLPWSYELWKQSHGRLARTGQHSPRINSHVLLCGSADRSVLTALKSKGGVENRLLDSLLSKVP